MQGENLWQISITLVVIVSPLNSATVYTVHCFDPHILDINPQRIHGNLRILPWFHVLPFHLHSGNDRVLNTAYYIITIHYQANLNLFVLLTISFQSQHPYMIKKSTVVQKQMLHNVKSIDGMSKKYHLLFENFLSLNQAVHVYRHGR